MMASVLVRLGRIWGDEQLLERGEGVLRLLAPAMERVPRSFSWALCALHLHLSPPRELAVVGDVRSEVARAALAGFTPGTVVAVGPSEDVPLLAGQGLVDGRAGGLRLRALRLPRAGDAAGGAPSLDCGAWRPRRSRGRKRSRGTSPISTRRSTTHASTRTSRRPRPTRRRSASATTARSRTSTRAASPRRSPSTSGSRSSVVRPLTYAHLVFAANMAEPTHGALVARLGEKAASLETQLLFFALEWAAVEDDAAAGAARRSRARPLAPPPRVAAQVPPVPALRARGADRHGEDRVGRVGVVAPLRGAARSAPRVARRRGGVARDGDGAAVRRRPRRPPLEAAEAITEALGPGLRTRTFVFNTILLDKSIDDRLRGYPTWISSRNLSNETTDEAVEALIEATTSRYDVAQRYYRLKARSSGSTASTTTTVTRRSRPTRSRCSWDEARRIVVDAYAEFSDEAGGDRLALLRRPAGSTGPCGPTSGRARSARRPSRACTPTS